MVRAGLADTAATVSLGRAAAERRSMFYASAAGLTVDLHPKHTYRKNVTKKLPTKLVRTRMIRTRSSTAAKNRLGSSTRKSNSKRLEPYFLPIFKFQRRGATGSRARKLLPLCHRRGSAPRSPYPPLLNIGSMGKL